MTPLTYSKCLAAEEVTEPFDPDVLDQKHI